MLGWAGHSALEGGEVGGDAVDVEVNEGLLVFFGEEEGAVGGVVHEEVFGEDGVAAGRSLLVDERVFLNGPSFTA